MKHPSRVLSVPIDPIADASVRRGGLAASPAPRLGRGGDDGGRGGDDGGPRFGLGDDVGSLQTHQTTKIRSTLRCDVCNEPIEGEPTGRGLLMWSRGGEVRLDEEPALCANCSTAIGVTALAAWNVEEDEG